LKNNYRAVFAWLCVALCALAIFVTVPLARTIQKIIEERWGSEFFGYFVIISIGLAIFLTLFLLIFKLKIRSASNYIWLIVIGGTYVYFTLKLWEVPVEAIHFLEYGLLGFFIFNALKLKIKDKTIFLTAFLFGMSDRNLR